MRSIQIMRHLILGLAVAVTVILVMSRPPIPQDPAYHLFADRRPWLGIPNGLNVVSNLPFAIVGLTGLALIFRPGRSNPNPNVNATSTSTSSGAGTVSGSSSGPSFPAMFSDPWERWPYAALFAGTALTALGSIYYHLAPDNQRLLWDRLPMTLGFTGLLTAILGERIGTGIARRSLLPLLLFGAMSVVYWYWSEQNGQGDLRWYSLVQFGSLLSVVLLILLYPPRYSGSAWLIAGLAAYAAAKGLELLDLNIFEMGRIVSGHSLKHLAAAAGIACLIVMLRKRTPRNDASTKRYRPGP